MPVIVGLDHDVVRLRIRSPHQRIRQRLTVTVIASLDRRDHTISKMPYVADLGSGYTVSVEVRDGIYTMLASGRDVGPMAFRNLYRSTGQMLSDAELFARYFLEKRTGQIIPRRLEWAPHGNCSGDEAELTPKPNKP